MHRIDNATAAASLPTPAAPGTAGYWTKGDPGTGTPATVMDQDFFNAIQEELIGLLAASGVTPAKGTNDQVAKAGKRMAGGNVTGLSANTTLTADNAGLVYVSAASGNVTLTLPAANAAGGAPLRFAFIRTDATGNTVTVQRAGSDLIDGQTSLGVLAGQRVVVAGNGSSVWSVLSGLGGLARGDTAAFSGGGGAAGFTGSWTVPAYVTRIFVRAWGAGGGGGGSAGSSAGGGGGGGGYAEGWYQVAPGTVLSVQAGTGGAAGGSGLAGANGTASFVSAPSGPVTGTLLSAGGGGGGGGASTTTTGTAGAGGTSSGGAFQPAGGAGQSGQLIGAEYYGGNAGSAPLAGGGAYPGTAGAIFGSGGGGGWNNAVAPGAGAGGLVTISW